jgi:hypothetical protein|tara:strand:+ start:81 stop:386 length:306 start_codon:yes stop_codon:yes gene_type:complete
MIMEKTTNVGGTFLQGYIKATYEQLLKAFGEPHDPDGDNYKTDVEWAFKFADGTVATIYNWKNGHNYLGEAEGLELNDITEWHVGGFNQKAVARVIDAIEK